MIIKIIFITNGIYDLMCALSILWLYPYPIFNFLSQLHPTVFTQKYINNPVIRRLLAYWIFTYGMTRTIAGLYNDPNLKIVGSLTYFIEAFCFKYEDKFYNTMIHNKATFVSMSSLFLGTFILLH